MPYKAYSVRARLPYTYSYSHQPSMRSVIARSAHDAQRHRPRPASMMRSVIARSAHDAQVIARSVHDAQRRRPRPASMMPNASSRLPHTLLELMRQAFTDIST